MMGRFRVGILVGLFASRLIGGPRRGRTRADARRGCARRRGRRGCSAHGAEDRCGTGGDVPGGGVGDHAVRRHDGEGVRDRRGLRCPRWAGARALLEHRIRAGRLLPDARMCSPFVPHGERRDLAPLLRRTRRSELPRTPPCRPEWRSLFGPTTCVPRCSYDMSGDVPTGCVGKDTCRAFSLAPETGLGYCWGGCIADSDCEAGQHCQTDHGTCVAGVVPPTKTIGEACTATDTNDGACRCFYGDSSGMGYCSSFCVVGAPGMCPSGYVCDSLELRLYGYTTQNTGMAGWCVATCVSGSAPDAGACPPNSTCSDISAAGHDCSV